ncbi:conserved hypothetical protein [Microsporum canis CBS 113480]|uniref:Mid2 domain-containing protein n=1 Tax=Arthroderma otae (strain ATCC MYA-4605 / CBS 113480) TaxID=554155 RepID=C5FC15_ARTOC|nr:conserved hypothetical protein [Microsporum canis CBS 113480]EEQ27438.1 conserved hypothetical protein [Microsporum canis CBS 113480]
MLLSRNFLYLVLTAPLCAGRACYFPDGSPASNDVPCFSGDRNTHCCSKSSICMTNGYCLESTQPYVLGRGSCTDKTWITSTKGSGCSIVLYSFLKGTALYCANSIVSNSSDSITCAGNTEPFLINDGDVITNKALLERASCSVPRLNPTASNSDGTHASATSVPVEHETSGASNVAIGAGVGVPLGLLAIGAIGWALYERKKRYRLINSYSSQSTETQLPPIQPQTQPMAAQPYEMPPTSKPTHFTTAPQELGDENR